MRRDLIHLALALALVPLTVAIVLKRLPDVPTGVLAFPRPSHRVAMAVDEALRAELATVVFVSPRMYQAQSLRQSDGKFPTIDKFTIPEDYPAFWLTVQGLPGGPTPMTPIGMKFDGSTRDGREIHVAIKEDSLGKGSLVDCHGDAALAKVLAPKIADRLAHLKYKHESAEDRAALVAFFGPKPTAAKAPNGAADPAVRRASETDDAAGPSTKDGNSTNGPN